MEPLPDASNATAGVPILPYAQIADSTRRVGIWSLVAGYLSLLTVIVSLLTTLFGSVEVIIVTGGILASIGFGMLLAGLLKGILWTAVVGGLQVGICGLTFALIYWAGWGPTRATNPVIVIHVVYVLALTFCVVFARVGRPKMLPPADVA